MDMDIDLYSTGSGANEKLYLGAQPVHYLINKNGYIYQDSSYQNKMTGKRDPATVKLKLNSKLLKLIRIYTSSTELFVK